MKTSRKLLRFGLFTLGIAAILLAFTAAGIYAYLAPQLPSIEILKDVRLQVPLRVFTQDGQLMGEFGEKKRAPKSIEEVPEQMIKAILAAEDDRYFEHPGVDYQGILRAAWHLLRTGEKAQGGSTITMQVARNFFLSREKTYLRKINEILLALKIERELSKEEILELYLNKIYLGNRAYGVGAAAQIYYGEDLNDLTLEQMAMIAGLPKAPSRYNPIADPARALVRRNYVLERMHTLDIISDETLQSALLTPDTAILHSQDVGVEAPYVAEMVRRTMVQEYGPEAYTGGYRVYTTIDARLQESANKALRKAARDYDQRHGFRGPEQHVDLPPGALPEDWQAALASTTSIAGLHPALVIGVEDQSATVYLKDGTGVLIDWAGLSWARRYRDANHRGPAPSSASDIVQLGDIVRVEQDAEHSWHLAQIPTVGGALVSLRPHDGAVAALVGGFDYRHSKFNRVVQAQRQPGSSFKPFVYSAALEKGYTAASIINDAPVVFNDEGLEEAWRPENYSGKFFGPTRLRVALAHSRNLVSIRLLRSIGISYAIDYVTKFGFRASSLPRDLSLALGSASVTPMEIATAYSVFANGGYLVQPYLITKVENVHGEPVYHNGLGVGCAECARAVPTPAPVPDNGATPSPDRPHRQIPSEQVGDPVITAQNAYIMSTMMRDVIRHGTGRKALRLGRRDLAGKTGTTNDQRDAWFSGFNTEVVTTTWLGFDDAQPLGERETGGRAALPMWIEFMGTALEGMPEGIMEQPPELVTVRIDPETGLLTTAQNPNAIFEIFPSALVPQQEALSPPAGSSDATGGTKEATEQLF